MVRSLKILLFLLCIGLSPAFAQDTDTMTIPPKMETAAVKDTLVPVKKKFQPDAKRAGLYSALIPGFGQLYNRQYWKMPIVYAVMGTPVYFAIKHNNDYQRYRKAYISRLVNEQTSNDEFKGVLTTAGIKQYQDQARQNRDMMILYASLAYTVQIIEAIAGAHLKNFDISKDLSLNIRPDFNPLMGGAGLSLAVQLRK
ncbi:DUF5683 domain-containing protein [Rurimicrobium arvi]|uniref:DUF5683 domain-containing protein n=1 Tax=Rurimicrobium arvi TaxID=2049916 RepID=A0ABP8MFK1_9BACT